MSEPALCKLFLGVTLALASLLNTNYVAPAKGAQQIGMHGVWLLSIWERDCSEERDCLLSLQAAQRIDCP